MRVARHEEQMEFEMEFARGGDNPGLDKFHVHVRCFAAWEFCKGESARRASGWIVGTSLAWRSRASGG